MPFDNKAATKPAASLPLQFVHIEIAPVIGGKFSVSMQATLLDEQELEFVGEELATAHVRTLDDVLAVIRQNFGPLAACAT